MKVAFDDFDGRIDEKLNLRFGVNECGGSDSLLREKNVLGDESARGVAGGRVLEEERRSWK